MGLVFYSSIRRRGMGLVILPINQELRNGTSYFTHHSGGEEWD